METNEGLTFYERLAPGFIKKRPNGIVAEGTNFSQADLGLHPGSITCH